LECVGLARQTLGPDKVVIGVGGISSALHAVRMREAGADLLEIYTGFIYQGAPLVRQLNKVLA
jgi:dihydroorotate dehydrogenase